MAPPLVSGAPAPLVLAAVLTVWLAEELVGLQSMMVTLELEFAGTDAIISIVIWERTVAELSILLRLSFAIAVMMRAIPPIKPTTSTSVAINISISVKPACGCLTALSPCLNA
jgi:hypothetical protein